MYDQVSDTSYRALPSIRARELAGQPLEDLGIADVELAAGVLADGLADVVPAVDADAELLEELRDGNLQGDGVAFHGLLKQN